MATDQAVLNDQWARYKPTAESPWNLGRNLADGPDASVSRLLSGQRGGPRDGCLLQRVRPPSGRERLRAHRPWNGRIGDARRRRRASGCAWHCTQSYGPNRRQPENINDRNLEEARKQASVLVLAIDIIDRDHALPDRRPCGRADRFAVAARASASEIGGAMRCIRSGPTVRNASSAIRVSA